MAKDDSPFIVGDYWLDKRRDGRAADIWQIARYSVESRSILYRSTKQRDLDAAKGILLAHVNAERAKGPQTPEEAGVLPQLFLYYEEHGKHVRKPDVIEGSFRAFIGFLMQDEAGIGVTVAGITPNLIRRFIAWRSGPHSYCVRWKGKEYKHASQGIKGESIQRNIEDVRAALNHAANNARIPYVPKIPSVPKEKRSPARDVVLTIDEMGAILAFMSFDKPTWRWVVLMMTTASRPDACLAFDPTTQWRGHLIDMHPKDWPLTKKRNPTIPAIEPLLPILKDWKSDPHKPVRSRRSAWRKMRGALGLAENIVPKTIRHTIATQLRTRGVPQEQISTLLGHSYGNRTTGVYAKYDPDYLRRAVESLSTVWGEICTAADQWHADHLRTTKGNKRGIVVDRETENV